MRSLMSLLLSTARTITSFALDALFPESCLGCHRVGGILCGPCGISVRVLPFCCFACGMLRPGGKRKIAGSTCPGCRKKTAVDRFFAPGNYRDELLRSLIHRFKYGRARSLAGFFAGFLASSLAARGITIPGHTLIIPIPLHPVRRRRRGFNQSLLIARHLAELVGRRCLTGILQRTKPTQPQMLLAAAKRHHNMQGVFAVVQGEELAGATIVLVDDVKTTGATLEEAAFTLKAAGARRVWAIAVAR